MTHKVSRRRFLRQAGRSAVMLGGLSGNGTPAALSAFQQAPTLPDLPTFDGSLASDEAALAFAAVDQGRLVTRRPRAVLRPGSVQDVVRIVQYAHAHRIPVAMRGRGHSRYGLSLVEGGFVIDSRSLNKIIGVTADGMDVQAGCALTAIIGAGLDAGYAVPVMTECTMLSVGGFLSVGGQTQGGQRFGGFVDQVRELDVVTGDGRLVTCSESRERELFEMTLAGLGQCGIVVRATLRVMRAPEQVTVRTITFDTIEPFLAEQERLIGAERLDVMSGNIRQRAGGGWDYVITVAGYGSNGADADPIRFLPKGGSGKISDAVRQSYREYFGNRNPLLTPPAPVASAAGQGAPRRPVAGPSLAVWLPASATRDLVASCLAVPEDTAGITAIECTGLPTAPFGRPLFRLPNEKHWFAFWALRSVFADEGPTLEAQLAANQKFLAQGLRKGAKRYPPVGGMATVAEWQAHYGDALYRRFSAAKAKYDPRRILTPGPHVFA